MNEYIIVNKTAIEKRIEELEKEETFYEEDSIRNFAKIQELKQILSQSTLLIPEIEKAFDAGSDYGEDCANSSMGVGEDYPNKQDYISNLKLDI